jgi:beta-glucanase (GH16 family)
MRSTVPLSTESPQFLRLSVVEGASGAFQAVPSLSEGGFSTTPGFIDYFNYGWKSTQTAWRVADFLQNGTQMSPDRVTVSTSGILTETVLAGEPYRGGSIETWDEFGWGRWVARVRPSPVPGVLNSIFVKDWDDRTTPGDGTDGTKAEIDFEFLTHTFGPGTGEVHIAVHFADASPLFSVDIPLDFNPSDAFHEWGFDILPDRVVWHVDGEFLYEWIYTETHAMNVDYEFFFNAWTRDVWILGPPDEDAHYEIDWVRFFPLQ